MLFYYNYVLVLFLGIGIAQARGTFRDKIHLLATNSVHPTNKEKKFLKVYEWCVAPYDCETWKREKKIKDYCNGALSKYGGNSVDKTNNEPGSTEQKKKKGKTRTLPWYKSQKEQNEKGSYCITLI